MEWNKILYSVIVIVLYLPVVFMGANVFFEDLDYPRDECFRKTVVEISEEERVEQENCLNSYQDKINEYEREKKIIDGWKYIFIVALSLVALLGALLLPLDSSIRMGLFLGASLASFFSTWIYFQSRSIIGFIVLILIFVGSLFFIQKHLLFSKKKRKKL